MNSSKHVAGDEESLAHHIRSIDVDGVDYLGENLGPLKRLKMTFEPGVTVIVGKNGVGKTSLLKTLRNANSASGRGITKPGHIMTDEERAVETRGLFGYHIETSEKFGGEVVFAGLRGMEGNSPRFRGNAPHTHERMLEALRGLLRDRFTRHKDLVWRTKSFDHRDLVVEQLKEALLNAPLLKEVKLRVELDMETSEVSLQKEGRAVKYEILSSGEKIILDLIVGLHLALVRDDYIGSEEEVFLIDEIEGHLHPAWQRKIIPLLRRSFPKAQFIVTTHSPQVVGSVDARCVRVLTLDSDGFSQVTTPLATKGLDSNFILEALMESEERDPGAADAIRDFSNAVSAQDWSRAADILEQIELDYEADDVTVPQLRVRLELAKRRSAR